MRKIPWKNKFDAAVCWWGSFGYFNEKGNRDFVKAVSSSLKKGGRFIIDTHTMETLLPKYQPRGGRILEILKYSRIEDSILLTVE